MGVLIGGLISGLSVLICGIIGIIGGLNGKIRSNPWSNLLNN